MPQFKLELQSQTESKLVVVFNAAELEAISNAALEQVAQTVPCAKGLSMRLFADQNKEAFALAWATEMYGVAEDYLKREFNLDMVGYSFDDKASRPQQNGSHEMVFIVTHHARALIVGYRGICLRQIALKHNLQHIHEVLATEGYMLLDAAPYELGAFALLETLRCVPIDQASETVIATKVLMQNSKRLSCEEACKIMDSLDDYLQECKEFIWFENDCQQIYERISSQNSIVYNEYEKQIFLGLSSQENKKSLRLFELDFILRRVARQEGIDMLPLHDCSQAEYAVRSLENLKRNIAFIKKHAVMTADDPALGEAQFERFLRHD